jgi:hypothetical protein
LKKTHKEELDQLQKLTRDKFKRTKQKAQEKEKVLHAANDSLKLELEESRAAGSGVDGGARQEIQAAKALAKKLVRQAEETMSGMCADLKEAKAEATQERERAASLRTAMCAKESEYAAELEKVKNEAKQQMAKQVEFFGKMQRHQKHTVKQETVKEEQTKSAVKQETLAASLLEQQADLKRELQEARDSNKELIRKLGEATDEASMAQATAKSLEESGGEAVQVRQGRLIVAAMQLLVAPSCMHFHK